MQNILLYIWTEHMSAHCSYIIYSQGIEHTNLYQLIWACPWKTWLSTFFLFWIPKFRSERKNINFKYTTLRQWPSGSRDCCLFNGHFIKYIHVLFIFFLSNQNFTIMKWKIVLNHVFHGQAHFQCRVLLKVLSKKKWILLHINKYYFKWTK